jgi:spermidine synthase
MNQKIVYEGDTEIAHYIVEDSIYVGRPARVLYTNSRMAAQSGMALDGISEMLFDYNERFLELARALKPKSVLVIGGGAFTLPSAVLKEFPKIRLDVIEIDQGLVKIAKEYFDFKPSANTSVYVADASSFVEKLDSKYDLIIMDVYEEASIPEAFQNDLFVHKLASKLEDKGVIAMNIIAAYHGLRSHILKNFMTNLSYTCDVIKVFPAGSGLNLWIPQNFVLTASKFEHNLESYLRYAPVNKNES